MSCSVFASIKCLRITESPFPQPVVTRWGTWIEAVLFYAKYLSEVKGVVDSFDAEDPVAVASAQSSMASPDAAAQCAYIDAYFRPIPGIIKCLESRMNLCLFRKGALLERWLVLEVAFSK